MKDKRHKIAENEDIQLKGVFDFLKKGLPTIKTGIENEQYAAVMRLLDTPFVKLSKHSNNSNVSFIHNLFKSCYNILEHLSVKKMKEGFTVFPLLVSDDMFSNIKDAIFYSALKQAKDKIKGEALHRNLVWLDIWDLFKTL